MSKKKCLVKVLSVFITAMFVCIGCGNKSNSTNSIADYVEQICNDVKAIFKGKKPVSERLLKLDAERFKKGDLPLSNLLSKYCSYIAQSN